jgi:hypothetical protein
MTADVQFTAEEVSELDTAASKIMIYGDRYTVIEKYGWKNSLRTI